MSLTTYQIRYIVPIDDTDPPTTTFYQGISRGVVEALPVLQALSVLPYNIVELGLGRERTAGWRMAFGWPTVYPLRVDLLAEALRRLPGPFLIVCSTPNTEDRVYEQLATLDRRILHISSSGRAPSIRYEDFSRVALRDALKASLADEAIVLEEFERERLAQVLTRFTEFPLEEIPIRPSNHAVTRPLETAIRVPGFICAGAPREIIPSSNKPYWEAMRECVQYLEACRVQLQRESPTPTVIPTAELILSSPSLFKHLYGAKARHRGPGSEEKVLSAVIKMLAKQERFYFLPSAKDGKLLLENPLAQALVKERQDELAVYTAALSIRAAAHFTPTVRLPPLSEGSRQAIKQLCHSVRHGRSDTTRKQSLLASRLSKSLDRDLPEWLRDHIAGVDGHIKLISDSPLEWLPIKGVPLMLLKDLSRIPTTPGNVFVLETLSQEEVRIPYEAFNECLVIRFFDSKDPLRPLVEQALQIIARHVGRPDSGYRIVDVATEAELIAALNAFDGAVAVFDGHGDHSSDPDIGTLRIGSRGIDMWQLRAQARVPPIVILSACDTHPMDGSHASVANGLITSGAVTVIATSLPIRGDRAALFVGRMLLRIKEFLPLLLGRDSRIARWSEVFSGLQRMVYTSEILWVLNGADGIQITEETFHEVSVRANELINTGRPDWFEQVLERLAAKLDRPLSQVRQLVATRAYLTDSLKYIQLGNPESLIIFDPLEGSGGPSPKPKS